MDAEALRTRLEADEAEALARLGSEQFLRALAGGDPRPGPLLDACTGADLAVVNAFESDELGTEDAVSRNEGTALDGLGNWADERHRLG